MLWRVLPQLYFITQTKVSPEQRSSGRRAGVPFGVCLDERWLSEIEVCHPSLGSELSMVLTLGIQAVLRSVARNLPCHGTRRRPPPPPAPRNSRVLAGILGGTLGVLYHAEEVGECSVQRADLTVLVLRCFPQRRLPSYDWYTQCHFLALSDRNSLRRSRNPHKYFAMDVEDEENMSKT